MPLRSRGCALGPLDLGWSDDHWAYLTRPLQASRITSSKKPKTEAPDCQKILEAVLSTMTFTLQVKDRNTVCPKHSRI